MRPAWHREQALRILVGGAMQTAQREIGRSRGEHRENGHDVRREMLAVANAEGRFTSLNASWERILGWSRDELMARPLIEFVHPEDVERTVAHHGLGPDPGRELVGFENRFRTKGGEYRWLSWHAYSDGDTWLAAAADVTERKLVTGDLEQAI